jgi:hypothetical protein
MAALSRILRKTPSGLTGRGRMAARPLPRPAGRTDTGLGNFFFPV